jgi:hypothetical protein
MIREGWQGAINALYANFFATNSLKAKAKRGGWTRPLQDHVKINVDGSFGQNMLRGTT